MDVFSADVYSMEQNSSGISLGLLSSKSRLSKQDLMIPKRELVTCHMSVNLLAKVNKVIFGYLVEKLIG